MPATDKEFSTSVVNYLNKDFFDFKKELINYAKTYFPNTYKDFNETSPGMMLMEMSAYVGDVLSFYIDQQYKEMLLPLAQERSNIVTLASMLGYKVKPVSAAVATLDVTLNIDTDGTADIENPRPKWADAFVINSGMQVETGDGVVFETTDIVDFTVSGAYDPAPTPATFDSTTNLVTSWNIKRKVAAISAETKTATFTIGAPEQFKEITLPEDNVVDILEVKDTGNNRWYEVQYLAQDKIPKETHYTNAVDRSSAYSALGNSSTYEIPVPYTLDYISSTKRFTVETTANRKTKLVFGNGMLKTGATNGLMNDFLSTQQAGITVPGEASVIDTTIDPTLGSVYNTLGETPAHTTLKVKYRIGGGVKANVGSGELTQFNFTNGTSPAGRTVDNVTITNAQPARGGSGAESIEEIRQRAKANFLTQNRAVTKEDYEARVMGLPAKFGNVAKVYIQRAGISNTATNKIFGGEFTAEISSVLSTILAAGQDGTLANVDLTNINVGAFDLDGDGTFTSTDVALYGQNQSFLAGLASTDVAYDNIALATLELYILSYNHKKQLVTSPALLQANIQEYLKQYRMITDFVTINQGYIINFGVVFDVTATPGYSREAVKLNCIGKIKKYFAIENMQFRQPIYLGDLEYELLQVEGVRNVNSLCITQQYDYGSYPGATSNIDGTMIWQDPLYSVENDGSILNETGYGYKYDFFAATENNTIRPSVEPSIFELKNPNQNIKGVVN